MSRGRHKPLTPAVEAIILRLHGEGYTQTEIGRLVGFSHETVRQVLARRLPRPACPVCGEPTRIGRSVATCGAPECVRRYKADAARAAERTCSFCRAPFAPAGREALCSACRLKCDARTVRSRRVDHAEAVRLYREGLSQREIARRLGCGQSTVGDALRAAGVAPDHRHRG